MEHSFDVEVANIVGINAAILYKNIQYWCLKNKANDVHFHDGYYWTYNSKKAFSELFPYLTERQIDYALNKLIEAKYIIKGNYNSSPYDKTNWYADCLLDCTIMCNQSHNDVQPIPYNKQQIKNNDITSNDVIYSDTPQEFNFGEKTKKPNLYQKCISLINDFTTDAKVRKYLKDYLDVCMEMKSIRGANQWKGMLNTLEKCYQECKSKHGYCDIIQNSIDHGWKTFYAIKDDNYRHYNNNFKSTVSNADYKCDKFKEGYKEELENSKARDENGNYLVF